MLKRDGRRLAAAGARRSYTCIMFNHDQIGRFGGCEIEGTMGGGEVLAGEWVGGCGGVGGRSVVGVGG